MEEAGFKGLVAEGFVGFFAPLQTPQPVVVQLNATTDKSLRDPKVAGALDKAGVIVRGSSSDEFTRYVRDETDKWRRVIVEAKLKSE